MFTNGEFYIGQTSNYKKRFANYASTKGKGSPKLHNAWLTMGDPEVHILEEIESEAMLNEREIFWIEHLQPTLNTLPGKEALKGLNHPRIKYSKEQIIEVVELFVTSTLTKKEISIKTGVGYGLVCDVLKQRAHLWVWDILPKSYKDLVIQAHDKQTFAVYDKDNNYYEADNIINLAKLTNSSPSTIGNLFKGKGSSLGFSIQPHKIMTLSHENHGTFTDTEINLKSLLRKTYKLNAYNLKQIFQLNKPSVGWKILNCQ